MITALPGCGKDDVLLGPSSICFHRKIVQDTVPSIPICQPAALQCINPALWYPWLPLYEVEWTIILDYV